MSERRIGAISMVTFVVTVVTVFYPSIKLMPLRPYWSTISGAPISSSIFETSQLFSIFDSPVAILPSALLCLVAVLVAIRIYREGWKLERRLLSGLLCLLTAKDLVPLLAAVILVGLQRWPPIRLGVWDWIWVSAFVLQTLCVMVIVRRIGFARDFVAIRTLWTAQSTPAGLLLVGFGVQRLIAFWMGLKAVAAGWPVAASILMSVGAFGLLVLGIGLVVVIDHRVSTDLLAGAVLALGMSLLLSSLMHARLGIWFFGLVYISLGLASGILSALFFAKATSWLPSRRLASTLP